MDTNSFKSAPLPERIAEVEKRLDRYRQLLAVVAWCDELTCRARGTKAPENERIREQWQHRADADRSAGRDVMFVPEYYIESEIAPYRRDAVLELQAISAAMLPVDCATLLDALRAKEAELDVARARYNQKASELIMQVNTVTGERDEARAKLADAQAGHEGCKELLRSVAGCARGLRPLSDEANTVIGPLAERLAQAERDKEAMRGALEKTANYLESATNIIEEDDEDEDDIRDAREVIAEARKILSAHGALVPREGGAGKAERPAGEEEFRAGPLTVALRMACDTFESAEEPLLILFSRDGLRFRWSNWAQMRPVEDGHWDLPHWKMRPFGRTWAEVEALAARRDAKPEPSK